MIQRLGLMRPVASISRLLIRFTGQSPLGPQDRPSWSRTHGLPRTSRPGGRPALAPAGPDRVPVQPQGGDGGVPGRAAAQSHGPTVPVATGSGAKAEPEAHAGRALYRQV